MTRTCFDIIPVGAFHLKPIAFCIVGGGWRAEYYAHTAALAPEKFKLEGVLLRKDSEIPSFARRFNIPVFRELDEMLSISQFSFVVMAVSKSSAAEVLVVLANRGIPVLAETPPGQTVESLDDIYRQIRNPAKIQVAEQYPYQPHHAARLKLIDMGWLGRIHETHLSTAHGYHAVALMRKYLRIGYADVQIIAMRINPTVMLGPSRSPESAIGRLAPTAVDYAMIQFSSGETGFYHFTREFLTNSETEATY
jgi:hypothetical protein